MSRFSESESTGDDAVEKTLFQVVFTKLPLLFIALVVIFLIKTTIVEETTKKIDSQVTIEAVGSVIVQLEWNNKSSSDVDLWVEAPDDDPVGYSNKGAKYFNLLRDDLGLTNDVTGNNGEIAMTRGIPTGEYTINVHLYRLGAADKLPIAGRVIVSCAPAKGKMVQTSLFTLPFELYETGQELTIKRFNLTSDQCNIDFARANSIYKPLRSASPPSTGNNGMAIQ